VLLRAAANIIWLPENFPLKVSAMWLPTESNFRLPNRIMRRKKLPTVIALVSERQSSLVDVRVRSH